MDLPNKKYQTFFELIDKTQAMNSKDQKEHGDLLKTKTIEEMDLQQYKTSGDDPNPYLRQFGSKTKSHFSVVR